MNFHSISHRLNRALKRMGFKLDRHNPRTSPELRIKHLINEKNIDCVIDIGANIGEFAISVRELGYLGCIVSFEPLTEAHAILLKRAASDPDWIVPPRMAIGDKNGNVLINVSANSVSSSIQPMLDSHRKAAPASKYVQTESVGLHTLDTLNDPYFRDRCSLFLKVDTQGYEQQVLDGAEKLLSKVELLMIELSAIPLYEGQTLLSEMIHGISALGFELHSLAPTFTDEKTGQIFQYDALFTKS